MGVTELVFELLALDLNLWVFIRDVAMLTTKGKKIITTC